MHTTQNKYLNFSDKIHPIVSFNRFPLNKEPLKSELCRANLWAIEEKLPFEVECHPLDNGISAVSENERAVACMPKMLTENERGYNFVGKQALAVIITIRKWKYPLLRYYFKFYTNARAGYFM